VGVTRTQVEIALVVVLLAAAWLVVGREDRLRPTGAEPPPARTANRGQQVDDRLPGRVEALRAYLATPRARGTVRRNLFDFRAPAARADRGGRAPADVAAVADPPPERPEMRLSGIAEETGNGRPVRTAVISVPGQLVFAREGDRVLSRFLVVRIAADAVQLKDDERGEVFTLALK